MPEFRYKARDATGGPRVGVVDATSRSAAASLLRSRGLIVIGVAPVSEPVESNLKLDLSQYLPPRAVDVRTQPPATLDDAQRGHAATLRSSSP